MQNCIDKTFQPM